MRNVQFFARKREIDMTYALHHREIVPCVEPKASAGTSARKTLGLFQRILAAIVDWRERQVDRDMARLLVQSSGRLTDELEREMTQRLLSGNWNLRR
jgi:hypothetical protein